MSTFSPSSAPRCFLSQDRAAVHCFGHRVERRSEFVCLQLDFLFGHLLSSSFLIASLTISRVTSGLLAFALPNAKLSR